MKAHPTRSAVELTFVGFALVGLGLLLQRANIFGWGSALLLGTYLAQSVTLLNVARIRASGFEMLWTNNQRNVRAGVGERVKLALEVRNRDARAVRFVHLRALASPHLAVLVSPTHGEVPAGGRLAVEVEICPSRVGRHGVFGISLEAQGAPGLYEVPLTFANPLGVEVLPKIYGPRISSARGGRQRRQAEEGRGGRRAEGNDDIRQLRAYQPGDPFKRVAWKASARRGKLLVREFEQSERDVVWLLLDASVEHWAGPSGQAPLDSAIEALAGVAERHLRRGDKVGLGILGRERLSWLVPKAGPTQAARLLQALSFETACHAAFRSTYDEADCALQVFEHLRPTLAAAVANEIERTDVHYHLDKIAFHAASRLAGAPFSVVAPQANTPREQALRHYLLAHGIDSPARLEPDQAYTDLGLLNALRDLSTARPAPSLIILCSPLPTLDHRAALLSGLEKRRRRGAELRWLAIPSFQGPALDARSAEANNPGSSERSDVVQRAQSLFSASQSISGERQLRRLGITLQDLRRRTLRGFPQNASAATRLG